ncbi:MAG: signal recognition particle-docking protein FtsY [Paenibacillaceae bacterium]|nr:signal recognition particle-docking protein FtsY [Paenibacillaceae bacterium]
MAGFFQKLRERIAGKAEQVTASFVEGLTRTRTALKAQLSSLFSRRTVIDEAFYEELEETLLRADVGVHTTMKLVDALRIRAKEQKCTEPAQLQPLLSELVMGLFREDDETELRMAQRGTTVVLCIGVNGVGKTTTIGKLAYVLQQQGKTVAVAAGDTFRAAAVDQLGVWSDRAGVHCIQGSPGSDPASVMFDAIRYATQHDIDVLLCDTAGRLHNKTNLMEELHKMVRIIQRELPGAPHEVLLVLDATTGQNALTQAKLFGEKAGITGIVLTKLDGTAKGGIVLAIRDQLGIPIKFVGLGEKLTDVHRFDAEQFVHALFV